MYLHEDRTQTGRQIFKATLERGPSNLGWVTLAFRSTSPNSGELAAGSE